MSTTDPILSKQPLQAEPVLERRPPARSRGALAGVLLIALGVLFLVQQFVGGLGEFFLLGLGLAFFAGYFYQGRGSGLIVPAGVLTGLGLGTLLASSPLVPGDLGGSAILGSMALGFLAIYLLERRHRWAVWPAGVLAVIAAIAFVAEAPLVGPIIAEALRLWPALLILGGLWFLLRRR